MISDSEPGGLAVFLSQFGENVFYSLKKEGRCSKILL